MQPKSIFASKTFWLNFLGTAATLGLEYGNLLPMKYSVSVLAVANIINRFFTSQPVSLLGSN